MSEIEEEFDRSPEAEMASLKEKATQIGVEFGAKIGLETLRQRVAVALTTPPEEEGPPDTSGLSKQEKFMKVREHLRKTELALVRVRIANLNPDKVEWPGEIITVVNKYLGAVRKFVPFGEATDNGYHIPQILLTQLKARKFLQKRTKTDPRTGDIQVTTRFVPEFGIEVLKPLTEKEVADLAASQASTRGID